MSPGLISALSSLPDSTVQFLFPNHVELLHDLCCTEQTPAMKCWFYRVSGVVLTSAVPNCTPFPQRGYQYLLDVPPSAVVVGFCL